MRTSYFLTRVLSPFLAFLILLSLLEFLSRQKILPSYIFPAPSQVGHILNQEKEMLFESFKLTAQASFLGLLLSVGVGFFLGALCYTVPLVSWILTPYPLFFQTVPIVALAPMILIWFGFGLKSVVVSSFIVSLFPLLSGSLMGLRSVEKSYLDLFSIYNASFRERFFKLLLPSALPYLFEALRVSSGLAVIGAIVGEFMSGSGLGSVIEVARVQYRVDLMFAAILLSTLLGLIYYLGVSALSYFFLRHWHSSHLGKSNL